MSPRIIYYSAQNHQPTGGNKVVYRHVDLLANSGFDAWVYHPSDGFCYSGIVDNPRVISHSAFTLNKIDVFVLPEDAGPGLVSFAPGVRKIIFNQNAYYTFYHYHLFQGASSVYENDEIIGAIVVSKDSENYLKFAFPGLQVERITLAIDTSIFKYVHWSRKRRQICFMTRKNQDDLIQVLNILSGRPSLQSWKFIPIQGLAESEVARIMGESMLFLSFNHPEGLSLSNLEALACGCYLIGYSGRAGKEYFSSTTSIEIDVGDIIGFCQAVEVFLAQVSLRNCNLQYATQKSSEYVKSFYSCDFEEQSVVKVINKFLH